MRSRNFVDEDVLNILNNISSSGSKEDLFPEHTFIAISLKIGLSISDLKELTYVDVLKILVGYINKNETNENYIKPTQEQIKMLTG